MRLGLLALLVLGLAIALLIALRDTAHPPSPALPTRLAAPESTPLATAPGVTTPAATKPVTAPPPNATRATPAASAASPSGDADAVSAWRARSGERDYAYWDMKLNLLRKIDSCVGGGLHTTGAAEVNFHFKKQPDGSWLADTATVRDPDDNERRNLGAVQFTGADLALAQKCIGEAFAGTSMPATGGTESLDNYEVRGQIMFPTAQDRAWKQTGIAPN